MPAGEVVETIETHMSWVFLTARHVYKLKKHVAMPHLDHRTLEARRRSCMNELRLGRRLAPSVYFDVLPVACSPHGIALREPGEIVDWIVVMRRLPETAMLPVAWAMGTVTDRDADALGDTLSAFYGTADRSPWSQARYRRQMRELVATYTEELITRGAPRDEVLAIARALFARIDVNPDLLDQRIAAGRIVDAHGDLRPEHVCLESPPVVIDPLEFDDDLRMLDAASELAFFSLECDRLGAHAFAQRVVARYAARADDTPPPPLVALYTGQHALARALIALRHTVDAPASEQPAWHARARDYLARARSLLAIP